MAQTIHMDEAAMVRTLDFVIRERLVSHYCYLIEKEMEEQLAKAKGTIRDSLRDLLKEVTLESLQRDRDAYNFADRLIVAFRFNPEPGDLVKDCDTHEIRSGGKR
jgi:hypothetical protein